MTQPTKIPFDKIAERALNRAEQLVSLWFPGGKRQGKEYKATNPMRDDKKAGSFSVNLDTGKWGDFAAGMSGLDLVSLYAYRYTGGDNIAAAYDLAEDLQMLHELPPRRDTTPREPRKPLPPPPPPKAKADKPRWIPIVPVPPEAPERPVGHYFKQKRPERSWCYRDAKGRILGYIDRYKSDNGGKEILPLTFCRQEGTEALRWSNIAFPEPRPLYGLDRLAARPDATVLLVEGEKCADVGTEEIEGLVTVSWPGGSNAVDKVDWSPLFGRRVIGWPDCDAQREKLTPEEKAAGVDPETKPLLSIDKQPGTKAMLKVFAKLAEHEGGRQWLMDIPAPLEKPSGWDISDARDEGLRGAELAEYIRAQSRVWPLVQAPEITQENIVEDVVGMFVDASAEEPASNVVQLRTVSKPTYTPSGANAGKAGDSGAGGTDWRAQLLRNDRLQLIDCRENVYWILRHDPTWKGTLAINEFTRAIVIKRPLPWGPNRVETVWEENDNLELGLWLAQQWHLIVRNELNLGRSAKWAAGEYTYHPVRDYLDSLQWDGTPRLETWLMDHLGVVESEYAKLSGQLWMIALAARIYKPGCLMRSMPILEGPQYKGKSTVLRILGGKWFSDAAFRLGDKDTYQLIQGVWIHEVAELDAFNKAESSAMKHFVSSPSDRFRAPYDREPKEWDRQVCFAGTVNKDQYFKDPTGNTRYWPWLTGQTDNINHESLTAARDQLFAEAVHRYKAGERWHPTNDEQDRLFTPQQEERELDEPWLQEVFKYLKSSSKPTTNSLELLTEAIGMEVSKIDGAHQATTRIGNVMKKLGWPKKRETSGARSWYWERPKDWGKEQPSAQPGEQGSGYGDFTK